MTSRVVAPGGNNGSDCAKKPPIWSCPPSAPSGVYSTASSAKSAMMVSMSPARNAYTCRPTTTSVLSTVFAVPVPAGAVAMLVLLSLAGLLS